MSKLHRRLLVITLFAMAAPASAGTEAVYRLGEAGKDAMILTIERSDDGAARIGMSDDQDDPHIVVRDGTAYIVGEGEDGAAGARLSDIPAVARRSTVFRKSLGSGDDALPDAPPVRQLTMRKGEPRKIAGVAGHVFIVSAASATPRHQFQVVVADDPELRSIGSAMAHSLDDVSGLLLLMPRGTAQHVGWLRQFSAIIAQGMPMQIDKALSLVRFVADVPVSPSRTALPRIYTVPEMVALAKRNATEQ